MKILVFSGFARPKKKARTRERVYADEELKRRGKHEKQEKNFLCLFAFVLSKYRGDYESR